MKTVLIATDFSDHAAQAARYGFNLAGQLRANVLLCNAFIVPAEVPGANLVTWPAFEYEELLEGSTYELKKLKRSLSKTSNQGFIPPVDFVNETGTVADVVNALIVNKDVVLTVIGTHEGSGLNALISTNHSKNLIGKTACPLLLVPPSASVRPVKKVAFATDFKTPLSDLETIHRLISLIRPLNAELLITHIYNEKQDKPDLDGRLQQLLVELSNKADYPNIYYRIVNNVNIDKGLDWLCQSGQVDILAMVHKEHGLWETIVKGSYTERMAARISIPLLVMRNAMEKA